MPDQPHPGHSLTRAEKSRQNRIHHWRGVWDQARQNLLAAEAQLRALGDTPEVSRAVKPGDGTSPQK